MRGFRPQASGSGLVGYSDGESGASDFPPADENDGRREEEKDPRREDEKDPRREDENDGLRESS
jgi:hypothetical protein